MFLNSVIVNRIQLELKMHFHDIKAKYDMHICSGMPSAVPHQKSNRTTQQ